MKPARVQPPQRGDHENDRVPEDLLALKRGLEAEGIGVQIPRPGATWEPFEPMLESRGISLTDMVIRLRRGGKL